MVKGCCRACGARNVNKLPSFHRERGSPADTTAAQQAVHTRLEIHKRVCSDCISKKNHSCGLKSSFFQTVFSRVPLAQWILNSEVATATLLGCWKNPSGTRRMTALSCSVYLYMVSLWDHWWNPHYHCACFRNWAHFWRRCHLKASRDMNFNEYIGLPTWDIPSHGTT